MIALMSASQTRNTANGNQNGPRFYKSFVKLSLWEVCVNSAINVRLSLLGIFFATLVGCDRNEKVVDTTLPDETVVANTNATIMGDLSFPSDYIPDDMQVCAEEVSTSEKHCDAKIAKKGSRKVYVLSVPAGRYQVYAQTDDKPGYRAYYSDAVVCGLEITCTSHKPITVTLAEGEQRSAIQPHDWYADISTERPEVASGTPSTIPDVPKWTRDESALITEWHALNEKCRGGSGDVPETMEACELRDGTVARRLTASNICYGREGEYGYQMTMHRCDATSLR